MAATRARILDAALAVLRRRGPRALSARSIAQELGVAHMTLFTYFPNQAALLEALAERETAPLRARQAALEAVADAAAVIRGSLALIPAFEREDPGLFHLAWVMPEQDADAMRRAHARAEATVAHLTRLIRRGIDQGVFRVADPALAAQAVIGMVSFPLVLRHMGRIGDTDRIVAEMLDAAMNYLRSGKGEA